ncbi:hypothetical protein [uncultured Thiodictyon sp.]|uniref:hypothetical protein n=1 Tax=uncultured Thiodictyon sp. TaxID=1846217 RepID=UPI0025FAE2C2|nr:hypothetical protein [uncultured Thiodictyon sp.]
MKFLLDTNVVSEFAKEQVNPGVLIAAVGLSRGMILVTRNTADFKRTGIKLLNPWQ